jgi:fructuronate reductase
MRYMLDEQLPTLPRSTHDIRAYAAQLLERWRNPGIEHLLTRVGRNGSEKLEARLLASARENLAAGRDARCTLLAVAAWILCVTGDVVRMEDARAARLRAIGVAAGGDAARLVEGVLRMEEVFGADLPRLPAFREGLRRAVAALQARGPLGAASLPH